MVEGVRYAFGFAADPGAAPAAGAGQLRGHAVQRAAAGVRGRRARRRAAHARASCPPRPGLGALAGALYLASRSSVLGLGRVIVVATLALGLALVGFSQSESLWLSAGAAGADRVRDDGADGGGEHAHPDDGGRGQAGPGDELLRDGVPGRGPVRQPAGRVARRGRRRPRGGRRVGGAGAARRAGVRHPAPAAAAARPAGVRPARHPAGGRGRGERGHRTRPGRAAG